MSAVVLLPGKRQVSADFLAKLRNDLGRPPGHVLSWKNIKGHPRRLHAASEVGAAAFLRISTVVVCKRDFESGKGTMPDEDFAYLYTFRFLLERLSWLARSMNINLRYTLSQIGRFPIRKLRHYENRLRDATTEIDWQYLDPKGGRIDQPVRIEQLQIADIAASATATAFEPDQFGNTERAYLEKFRPRLYTYPGGAITSYGLKMHPWNKTSKAAHPWLKDW